jgi:uncharacterized protein
VATLQHLEQLLREQPRRPPVEQWQPALSGAIDIRIDVRGDWYHDGTRIERQTLVNLFASILRREADGGYYLVTPVEKWRIQVDDAPLLAIDMEVAGAGGSQRIVFLLNDSEAVALDADHPLNVAFDSLTGEPRPYLQLERGLSARLTRALFYRLVDLAEEQRGELQVLSAGSRFSLGRYE